MKNKFFSVFCLFCFLPFVCAAEVHIFTVVPKSGPYKVFGDELTAGAQIAVDQINNAGGLYGQKLQLSFIDDACNETLALSTAQMLSVHTLARPNLVIGPYCSNGLDEIAKTYQKAKIFQIVPAFLSTTQNKKSPAGIIKLFGNKESAATDVFEFYNTHFAGLNAAIISSTDNLDFDTAILNTFKKHGKSGIIKQYHDADFQSLNELADTLIQNNTKVIFMFSRPKHTAKIIKKVYTRSQNTTFITSRYLATPDFFLNAENYLDTTYFMALPELENNPEMAQNVVNLRLKGIEFKGLNIYGYTAVQLWAEAVKQSKTFNYDKLSSYIKKHGLKTSWGETFYNNGNASKPLKYFFYKFQNGEFSLAQ